MSSPLGKDGRGHWAGQCAHGQGTAACLVVPEHRVCFCKSVWGQTGTSCVVSTGDSPGKRNRYVVGQKLM